MLISVRREHFSQLLFLGFKENKVDTYVLECGRGVLFDEVGQIPSKVSCVTTLLPEHLNFIGPTFEDVKNDKYSIASTSSFHFISILTGSWEVRTKKLSQ